MCDYVRSGCFVFLKKVNEFDWCMWYNVFVREIDKLEVIGGIAENKFNHSRRASS